MTVEMKLTKVLMLVLQLTVGRMNVLGPKIDPILDLNRLANLMLGLVPFMQLDRGLGLLSVGPPHIDSETIIALKSVAVVVASHVCARIVDHLGLPRAESEEFVPPFPPPDWVGPWPPPRREKRAPAKLPESPHHQPGIINLRPWNGGHGPHANALPPRPSNWDGHGGSRNSLPPLAPPTRSHSAFSSYNVPTQSDHYSPSIPSRHQTPDYSPYASPGMMERAGSIHSHHSSPYDPVRPIKIRAAHLLRSDRPRWNTLNSTVLVEPFATSTPLSRRNSNLSYNSHESIKQQNALDANKSLTASIPVPTLVAPVALDARVATPTPDKSSVAPEAKEKPNKKKHTSISKASKAKKAQGVVVTIPTEDIPIKSEEVDHQLLGDFEANTDVTTSIPGALEEHHVTQQALTETEASAGAAHGSLQSLTDEDVELFLMRLGVTGRARPTIGHGPAIAPLENVPHGIDGTAEREVVGTFTAIGDKSATNALALQVHHGPSSNLPVPPPPPENVASSEGQGSGSDALHVSSEVYQPSQLPTTLYDPETITYDPETGEPRFNTHLNKSTSPSSEQRRQEDDDSPRRTRKAPPAVDAAYGRRW
ncbi:MAG: hypothetical protein M1814_005129 [Vezdaea aestivalis]|nr:MAG: hypothetical protein M1814_005129 [Vezdaea aestivalis]